MIAGTQMPPSHRLSLRPRRPSVSPAGVRLVYLTRFTRDRAVVAVKDDDGVIFLAHRLNFINALAPTCSSRSLTGVMMPVPRLWFVCSRRRTDRMLLLCRSYCCEPHIKVFFQRRQQAMDFGKATYKKERIIVFYYQPVHPLQRLTNNRSSYLRGQYVSHYESPVGCTTP